MIKLFVMDVDGTMTDGKIYMGQAGEEMKAFSVKDGAGIDRLIKNGIVPVVITGRSSQIVTNRCNELGIKEIHQDVSNKKAELDILMQKYNVTLDNIAYIGDDLNDIECIKAAAIGACPADAFEEVITSSDYVCKLNGGSGAVREFAEYIMKQ